MAHTMVNTEKPNKKLVSDGFQPPHNSKLNFPEYIFIKITNKKEHTKYEFKRYTYQYNMKNPFRKYKLSLRITSHDSSCFNDFFMYKRK